MDFEILLSPAGQLQHNVDGFQAVWVRFTHRALDHVSTQPNVCAVSQLPQHCFHLGFRDLDSPGTKSFPRQDEQLLAAKAASLSQKLQYVALLDG
jgi:hypothetical protein